MANRIGFKEYLRKLEKDQDVQLIVDANIIIALKDKNHKDFKKLRDFFTAINDITSDVLLFTTITTKSEFLDYYRRKILTEGILAIYNKNREVQVISKEVKQEIEKQVRARNLRQNREVKKQEKLEEALGQKHFDTTEIDIEEFSVDANYFRDAEIKKIKKAFRGRDIPKEMGWKKFCEIILLEKLHSMERYLDEFCHYLTTRDSESLKHFVDKDVKWRMATQICGETGMGYSDAMILNMTNHTNIEHILTLDFDLVHGGHFSAKDKVIITPTERLKNYKNILKGVQ